LDAVTGFGKVYLVRKRGGVDDGTLYAMKVMQKDRFIRGKKLRELVMTERRVCEKVGGSPFLAKLQYAFQTDSKLHLILGEYIKYYMNDWRKSPLLLTKQSVSF
jgi:serine/threonine protein kinase